MGTLAACRELQDCARRTTGATVACTATRAPALVRELHSNAHTRLPEVVAYSGGKVRSRPHPHSSQRNTSSPPALCPWVVDRRCLLWQANLLSAGATSPRSSVGPELGKSLLLPVAHQGGSSGLGKQPTAVGRVPLLLVSGFVSVNMHVCYCRRRPYVV